MPSSTMTHCLSVAIAALGLLVTSSVLQAQQQPRSTGTGTTGTGTSTGTGRSTGTGTTTGTGGTMTGSGTTALGGAGGGNRAGAGQGGGMAGQGLQQPQLRSIDQLPNQSGRGTFGTTTAVFGASPSGGQQSSGTAILGPQLGVFGNRGLGAFGALTPGLGQTNVRSRAEQLRPQHRVAFSYTPPSSAAVTAQLQTQLRPLQTQGRIRGAQVSLSEDGTLTLRGTATTEEVRDLAAALARLEPGVRRVDNQIVVEYAGPATASPPNAP